MGMGITAFAEASGVPAHTLRRLHARGRLVPAMVLPSGHRRYEDWQIDDAKKFVKKMKLLPNGASIISKMPSIGGFFSYLLGLVLADGTILESGQVQLEMKDKRLLDKLALEMGCAVHPHKGRNMFRITVPRLYADRLKKHGVRRHKGSNGFEVPRMSVVDFGDFLRGLFDGDGSISRGGRVVRFHGHPLPMASIQATLLNEFGLYLPWIPDKRCGSGMLETGRRFVVESIGRLMYESNGVFLERKKFIQKP